MFNLIEWDTVNLLWGKLACRYKHREIIPGTHNYYQFCPVSVDGIGYKWRVMTMTWLVLLFSKTANPKVFDKIFATKSVACHYDNNWWVGLLQNVNCSEKDVEINFLHPPGPSDSFTWPKRKDISWVPCMNVIFKIRPSTIIIAQIYYLEKEDNEMMSKLLN